jgi:hypothetical protein
MNQIKFSFNTLFKGRNGMAKCSGIDLLVARIEEGEVVIMSPITSRNEVASSFIEVPIDSITDLIKALNEFNPSVVMIDTREQEFIQWVDTSACPQCNVERNGNIQPMSHTIGKCMECGAVIDLENWKILK